MPKILLTAEEKRLRRNAACLRYYYRKVKPVLAAATAERKKLRCICPQCGGPRVHKVKAGGGQFWFCRPCRNKYDREWFAAKKADPAKRAVLAAQWKQRRKRFQQRLKADPVLRKLVSERQYAYRIAAGLNQTTREERAAAKAMAQAAKIAARAALQERKLNRNLVSWLRHEMRIRPFTRKVLLTAEQKREAEREYQRRTRRKGRKELTLAAVKEKIRKHSGLKISQLPDEYVQAYRAYLLVRRKVTNDKDERP